VEKHSGKEKFPSDVRQSLMSIFNANSGTYSSIQEMAADA
jgi:hypothetical protein